MKNYGLLLVVGLFFSSLLQAPKYSTLTDFQLQHVLSSCMVSCSQEGVIKIKVPSFCEGLENVKDWLKNIDKKVGNPMVECELNPAMLTPYTFELAQLFAQKKVALKGDSSLSEVNFWLPNTYFFGMRFDDFDIHVLRFDHDEKGKHIPEHPVLGWYRLDPQNFSEESFSRIRLAALAPFIMNRYPFSKITVDELDELLPFAKLTKNEGDILILRATWEEGVVPLHIWNTLPPYAQYAWFKLNARKIDREYLRKLASQLEEREERGAEFMTRRRATQSQKPASPVSPRGRLQAAMDHVATTKSVVDAFSAGLQRPQKLAQLPIIKKVSSANAAG